MHYVCAHALHAALTRRLSLAFLCVICICIYIHIFIDIRSVTILSPKDRRTIVQPNFLYNIGRKKNWPQRQKEVFGGGVTEFGTGGYFGNCGLFICFEL